MLVIQASLFVAFTLVCIIPDPSVGNPNPWGFHSIGNAFESAGNAVMDPFKKTAGNVVSAAVPVVAVTGGVVGAAVPSLGIPAIDDLKSSINNFSLKLYIMNWIKTHFPNLRPEVFEDPAFLKDLGYDELVGAVKSALKDITACWAKEMEPVKQEFAAFFTGFGKVLAKQFS